MDKTKIFCQRLKVIILAAFMLSMPALATGATYYVDAVNGNDANPGTAAGTGFAWETITHAAANVPAGTPGTPNVIMVATGVYDVSTNFENYPINFTNDYVSLTNDGSGTSTINGELFIALDVDAVGFSVTGFSFTYTPVAIDISEGGFTIANNDFDASVADGVNFYRNETDLTDNISFADMSITGNTFNTTSYGIRVFVVLDFDDTYQEDNATSLTATFGDLTVTGNTFPVSSGFGATINFAAGDILNGTVTAGDFTITDNTFTGGNQGLSIANNMGRMEDSQITAGNTVVSDNTFTDQFTRAMRVDYWDMSRIYGATNAVFGDLTMSGNTVTATDYATYPNTDGIYINDLDFLENIYDETTVTFGTLNVTNNTVDVNDRALYIYSDGIYTIGEEYWGDTVSISTGPRNISNNTLNSNGGPYGAYIELAYLGEGVYGATQITYGDLNVTNNTVTADGDAFYLYLYRNGTEMFEDSASTIGTVTFDNNTLTSANSYGLYYDFYQNGSYLDQNGTTIIGPTNITNNTITSNSNEAMIFDFDENGYDNEQYSSFTVMPFTIDNNTISTINDNGIYIYYNLENNGANLYDHATVTMPDWIITNNSIDVTGNNDGIQIHNSNPYENYNYSQATYGSILVDGNTFNPNKDAGMNSGIYIYQDQVAENLYGPSTATFGEITVTNNMFYTIAGEAMYIEHDSFGYVLIGSPTLTQEDIEIAGNTIDTASVGIELQLDLSTEQAAVVEFGETNIHDNTMTNISGEGIHIANTNFNSDPGSAMLTVGALTITENIISGNTAPGDGIFMDIENDTDGIVYNMPTIFRNTISGFDHGIFIEDLEEASMSCNYIENNTLAGIRFSSTDGTDFAINNNSIVDNFVGLTIDDGDLAVIDAEKNWWGDKLGPSACATCNGVNPGTTGTIDYMPFLTYEPQKSRCGLPFPWVMFAPATTGMGPQP